MRVISIRKERILIVVYVLVIMAGLIKTMRDETVQAFSMPLAKKVILLDAGHGGFDPGKVSGEVLEKNINLGITLKLQKYLEQGGAYVLMTRVEDDGVGSTKNEDMRNRKTTANESKADIFISIHQNSYPSPSVQGAQVFYYDHSDSSMKLAVSIQNEIRTFVDSRNKREAKANQDYYVLRTTTMPAVIVECGFLSAPAEKEKLSDESYQDRIAWAIYMGVVKYFESGTSLT